MSRSAKAFLAGSIALTTFTVWGVHYIQERERMTMYQGVVKDEARMAAKRAAQSSSSAATSPAAPSPSPPDGLSIPSTPLSVRQAEYARNLKLQEELGREQGLRRSEEERRKLEVERERERREVAAESASSSSQAQSMRDVAWWSPDDDSMVNEEGPRQAGPDTPIRSALLLRIGRSQSPGLHR